MLGKRQGAKEGGMEGGGVGEKRQERKRGQQWQKWLWRWGHVSSGQEAVGCLLPNGVGSISQECDFTVHVCSLPLFTSPSNKQPRKSLVWKTGKILGFSG